ncbi:WD40/YVTN/BNR-like repeat-containing protein [Plantactinospora endophytica]|uniref:Exo-alpha-sialidase n=1 Tax=Plantactinospora endophytica TaxID=673535 RepID=A0ABQ4E858_9ACTN|nr:sialidase family protein [Plantactinospora endophytica]GIG90878.1 hypothetical protein Pen02_58140 [Plantactinospora endophytica]
MQTYPFDPAEVGQSVPQPPLADLAARAARRVRRRRALVSAAAVGMMALVALTAVPVVRGIGMTATATGDGAGGGYLTATAVLDGGTVVAVRYGECAAQFSVTTNDGRTWSPYRGPVGWRDDCGVPVSTSYRLFGPTVFVAEVRGVRYLTRDAGVSWQPAEEGVRPVDTLPPQVREARDGSAQMVDPTTGDLYQLSSLPRAGDGGLPRRAPDGSVWLLGSGAAAPPGGATTVPRVARSENAGRSWVPTAALPAVVRNPLLVPAGPEQAYVLGECPSGAVVYRTDDGGTSWFATYVPWDATEVATVNAAGHLLVGSWEPDGRFAVWVSRDGGRSFTKGETITVPDDPSVGQADGLIWVTSGAGWAATSTDGWWRTTEPRRG